MTPKNELQSMPHSEDCEKGLLCSLALAPSIFDEANGLQTPLFFIPAHKIVFERMLEVFQEHNSCPWIIFKETFTLSELGEVGGMDTLAEIFGFVPTAENWRFYFEKVAEMYQRRVAISAARAIMEKALDIHAPHERPIREICERAMSAISLAGETLKPERSFKAIVNEVVEDIIGGSQDRNFLIEMSGLRALNLALGGMITGEQIVIAAETSFGKTALALNLMAHMCLGDQRLKGIVFSFEMKTRALAERIISSMANVRMRALREKQVTKEDAKKMREFGASLPDERSILIEDSFGLTVSQIISTCRRAKSTGGLDVVLVDYLQLMNPERSNDSRQREIAEISRRLKILAGELDVIVIALSQVNDEGKMRESRAIAQDADVILVIQEPRETSDSFEREIVISKARSGPRGDKVKVDFFGDYVSFVNKS